MMHTTLDTDTGELARQARHIARLEHALQTAQAEQGHLRGELAAANRTLDALEAWAGVHDMGEQ